MSKDFDQFLEGYRNTTIQIFYYRPDYNSIIQEFVWQTMDLNPSFPRMNGFLYYWKENIEAVIQQVFIAYDGNLKPTEFKNVNGVYIIQ